MTIDLALGRRPDMPSHKGEFAIAAKFFNRVFFRDATVSRVPTPAEIEAVETKVPGTIVIPQVREGMRLSTLPEQDSYSYALAYIYMGARNQSSLLRNYERVVRSLPFRFTDIEEQIPATQTAMPE
ncbi:MAG: hypothetical protein ACR2I5_04560 [Candidatus Limnocylindria bacterium]